MAAIHIAGATRFTPVVTVFAIFHKAAFPDTIASTFHAVFATRSAVFDTVLSVFLDSRDMTSQVFRASDPASRAAFTADFLAMLLAIRTAHAQPAINPASITRELAISHCFPLVNILAICLII